MNDFERVKEIIGTALSRMTSEVWNPGDKIKFAATSFASIHQTLFGRSPTGHTATGKRKGG